MRMDFIKTLISDDSEAEWVEYKENWYEPEQLGEYISALSNRATMKGQPSAILLGASKTRLANSWVQNLIGW